MKMQALALGTVLGFLVAFTPSCTQPCGPANCGGCCKDNKCVDKASSANNTTCGTSGNACQDCSAMGSTCDNATFTCKGSGMAGGNAGGGMATAGGSAGGTACDGCKLGNGRCLRAGSTQQNTNACGKNAEDCHACTSPTTICDMTGTCVAPQKAIGDGCLADSECQATLGPNAVCRQMTEAGNMSYPGGTCTIMNCDPMQAPCPMGAGCIELPRFFGESQSMCVKAGCMPVSMSSLLQGDCRPQWGCLPAGQGNSICLPGQFVTQGAVYDTTGVIGQPCSNRDACRSPTPNAPGAGGFCFNEFVQFDDGGVRPLRDGGVQYTGFSGGYCSRDCASHADCTPNAEQNFAVGQCLGISDTSSACFAGCPDPNLGRSSCRSGYVCQGRNLTDGGLLDVGFCVPSCLAPDGGANEYVTCTLRDGGPGSCDPTGYCFDPLRRYPNRDAGVDGGLSDDAGMASDSGVATDSGVASDGGVTTDAGSTADAGAGIDGGTADAGSSDAGATCPDGGALFSDGGC